jgi:hypothetical protein
MKSFRGLTISRTSCSQLIILALCISIQLISRLTGEGLGDRGSITFRGRKVNFATIVRLGRLRGLLACDLGASRLLVLQGLGLNVAGVYRQLYRHCSEPLEHMAPVDRAAWTRAREAVHI